MSRRKEIKTIILIAAMLVLALVVYFRATAYPAAPEAALEIKAPVEESVAPAGASGEVSPAGDVLSVRAESTQRRAKGETGRETVSPLDTLSHGPKGSGPLENPEGDAGNAAALLEVIIDDSGAELLSASKPSASPAERVADGKEEQSNVEAADQREGAPREICDDVAGGIAYEDETRELLRYIGRYWVTGYDICVECCGKTDGITASGTVATVGRTVAAPMDMPFGTVLWIDGIGERVVEDRGGFADNTLDVLCVDHPACYAITGWYDVYEVVFPAAGGEYMEYLADKLLQVGEGYREDRDDD